MNAIEPLDHPEPIIRVKNLKQYFPIKKPGLWPGGEKMSVKAVDGIHFDIHQNEMFRPCLANRVAEKSTVARLLLRLIEKTSGKSVRSQQGSIEHPLLQEMRKLRSKMQMVFAGFLTRRSIPEERWVIS